MSLVCITNDLPGIRPCRVKGEHLDSCPNTDTCTGCLPRPATNGMLCASCWLRLIDTLDNIVDQMTHMRSLETGGGNTDNAGVRSAVVGYWPLAPGPVAADELLVDLVFTVLAYCHDTGRAMPTQLDGVRINGFKPGATIEQVADETQGLVDYLAGHEGELVARHTGAEWAVRLARSYQTKQTHHPLHESDHRVPFIRCRACQRIRLTWTPPSFFEDEVRIVCEHCGNVETQEMIEFDIHLIADQRKAKA